MAVVPLNQVRIRALDISTVGPYKDCSALYFQARANMRTRTIGPCVLPLALHHAHTYDFRTQRVLPRR